MAVMLITTFMVSIIMLVKWDVSLLVVSEAGTRVLGRGEGVRVRGEGGSKKGFWEREGRQDGEVGRGRCVWRERVSLLVVSVGRDGNFEEG